MTSTTVPDACTLPTEDQPIRVAEFEALFANEVVSATRHAPTRLALQLRPGCAAAVRDLTERESQCCSFFTFTVRDEPDGVVVAEAFTEAAGHSATLVLLDQHRPTALVASNDLLAIGCYDALEERGLTCPDDLSVVGFNDMPLIGRLKPALTSVHVPQHELGVEAGRLLLDQLSGRISTPRAVLLPVSLVVRASTSPPRRATPRRRPATERR